MGGQRSTVHPANRGVDRTRPADSPLRSASSKGWPTADPVARPSSWGRNDRATTVRRKRSVFYNAIQYAVEVEELEFNPIDNLRVRSQRKKVAEAVDRRVVVNQRQALELLIAVTCVGSRGREAKRGERLVAFFACLYFAALRPAEALALREQDCDLPLTGWGRLVLVDSPATGGQAVDRQRRGARPARSEAPSRGRAARRADPTRACEDSSRTHRAVWGCQGRSAVPQRKGQRGVLYDLLPGLEGGPGASADSGSGGVPGGGSAI